MKFLFLATVMLSSSPLLANSWQCIAKYEIDCESKYCGKVEREAFRFSISAEGSTFSNSTDFVHDKEPTIHIGKNVASFMTIYEGKKEEIQMIGQIKKTNSNKDSFIATVNSKSYEGICFN